MSHSVRLSLRLSHQCYLSIQEIPEAHCRLDIKSDPAGDDRVVIDLTIEQRGEPHNAEREVDDAVNGPPAEKEVAEHDTDVVGVGKLQGAVLGSHRQSFQDLADLNRKFASQQGFNQQYKPLNQTVLGPKESSGGDK